MKKIVALVLCLVLALSLCTVAMAAVTTTQIAKDGYSLVKLDDASAVAMTAAKFEKTVTGNATAADGTVTYTADKYLIDTVNYVACDASIATHKLVNGSTVVYLHRLGSENDLAKWSSSKVVTKKVAGVADTAKQVCGDYTETVYEIDKVMKVAATSTTVVLENIAFYNGLAVSFTAATPTTPKLHDFTSAKAVLTTKSTTDDSIVAVTCGACSKVFTVVDTLADVPATYTGAVDTISIAGDVILLDNTASAAGSTSTTVESAKTFDAGIALYAGMALASVAGSAVVIGKKKEF